MAYAGRKEYSASPEMIRVCRAPSSRFFVRRATAPDVKSTVISGGGASYNHYNGGEGDSMRGLKGWTQVGYYGFSHIYAKGSERRLVDPKTGRTTFEYKTTKSGTGHNVINTEGSSVSQGKRKQ